MKELLKEIADVTDQFMMGKLSEFAAVVMIMGLVFKAYDKLKLKEAN